MTPRGALTLSMVVHELATNAAKYGALSALDGRLRVRWTVERGGAETGQAAGRVRLDRQESDGPPVTMPERRGFGSRLIERSTRELDGDGELVFEPAGLRYWVTIPLNSSNALPD